MIDTITDIITIFDINVFVKVVVFFIFQLLDEYLMLRGQQNYNTPLNQLILNYCITSILIRFQPFE
jgi:hypothetical protein